MTSEHVRTLIEMTKEDEPEINNWINEFRVLCPWYEIRDVVENEEQYIEAMASYPWNKTNLKRPAIIDPQNIPTLDGKYWVKSQQELAIANALFINGINYEYEKLFSTEFEDLEFNYSPDFYYPEIELWHEHFAINKDGTSPFKGYEKEVKRKKREHEKWGINILYTYS